MNDTDDYSTVDFKNVSDDFNDFSKFEGDRVRRDAERNAFINNLEYTPHYDYPKLDFLIENHNINDIKRGIYDSVVKIEDVKKSGLYDEAELALYTAFHEAHLKRIMLVESARNLRNSVSASEVDINRQIFNKLNVANYGEFDVDLYLGLIASDRKQVGEFVAGNDIANVIQVDVLGLIEKIDTKNRVERQLMNDEVLSGLNQYVTQKYHSIFCTVPYTGDDVYYDVDDCVRIMNNALEVGGLADYGWGVEISSTKNNPATSTTKNTIYLPSDTRRNASELCRLIIHEQEVHARRAQNSRLYNLKPLEFGTANYDDIEEGLAVLLECAVTGSLKNSSFDRARNRYIVAGLALGCDGTPRDAREVYEIMWRMIAIKSSGDGVIFEADIINAKNVAYIHIENAYRGTQFWMKGVIYTRLKVYYEGLIKNADFITKYSDNLERAFAIAMLGKYDHTDPKEVGVVLTLLDKDVKITEL
jgi:hypothetical protein